MNFEPITTEQLSTEARYYLEFRFATLWAALEELPAIKVLCENGQTPQSLVMSLRYAAKAQKKHVRVLIAADKKGVLVINDK